MSSERQIKLTEKGLLHESKENAISIRGVLNSYCMQIMTRLCFVDRVDPGAVRVRSQKGDMTLGKITAACAKQLGAFLKKSPPTPSTLSLTKAEFERACTETFAACAKRQGVPEGKKKEGSGLAAESSPDKSGLSRRSSRIQGRSSMPSDALQIKPLQQVPLPTDALGKRKEREESSSEDSDNGKCISSKLRIPKGSAATPQRSALVIPKISPGKLPIGQALSLCKKPRGFASVGHLPGASSVTPAIGSFLATGSEGVAHVEGASFSPSKLPGEVTGEGVQDGLPMEVKSSAICAKLSEALTSASDLAVGSAVGHKRGSEGRRPSSASRKNKLLEDAFGEGFESADIIPLPVEASKVVEPETIPGGQESGAVKVTSVDSLSVDVSSLLPTASEFHPGDVTAVSPKGTNSFESPSAFLEQLTSFAVQTSVYLPNDLGEDDSLFVRPLKTYSSGTGTVALASDSIMVSMLAEGEKPVAPVASAAASAGGEASDRTGVMLEYGPSASNEVMEEMLRISRPHLPTEAIRSLSGQGDLLQQVSDHIWMSYVCASAARREYAAAMQNGAKLAEQMAKLEEERSGRKMAEANRDVLVEAIKRLETELAEAKKRVSATEEKLVSTVGLEVERDKLKADLVDMTNKWMEKSQFCVQHEARMEKLSSMMSDLEEDIVSLQTDKETLEKEKKELEQRANSLEASAAEAKKQNLEADLLLGKKLKEAEERAAEAAVEATRQRIRDREITERKLARVAEVDTAKYLDLVLRNKKQTPEEKWAKLEMYCKNVDVKIGEYDVDKYFDRAWGFADFLSAVSSGEVEAEGRYAGIDV
ncbi:uncharacterized protein LOC133812771 [Humulus lupulus]|uniref:uncharacterized protein LOC133812771 n=1 Tax=Humulus lupulus TaxID=3486 RepID=UPI002B4180B5|nr:uncharacterized protein LOC133812771 [Humulus lupulus]